MLPLFPLLLLCFLIFFVTTFFPIILVNAVLVQRTTVVTHQVLRL